jgi:predicted RNA-binding protein with PIN domain
MPYLIDGYNLLFSMGLADRRMASRAFEQARNGLIAWLDRRLGPAAAEATVVFDAQHVSRSGHAEEVHGALHVVYAVRRLADDLIEELIRHDSAPQKLVVVSGDHRIRDAARRRRCLPWTCDEFLDWLDRREKTGPTERPASEESAKPSAITPEETQHWLREFGDLSQDPAWKELFDAWDFDLPEEGEPGA